MSEWAQRLAALQSELARAHLPPADGSTLTRALYASDASVYRVPPLAVVRPRTSEQLAAIVEAARAAGVPITARGAGTSCAGNAVGPGLVVDCSRHLRAIHQIDPETRVARVDPGVVQQSLTRAAQAHGLRYGPDPSTASRCTIGGMIANNACGPRALGYGRASDNVVALDVVTGSGERLSLDSRQDLRGHDSPTVHALARLVEANLATIRREFGKFSRQVSGYGLDWLLPERGFDVAKFLAGSEGTLAVVTGATVRLVADDPVKTMLALGYPSMADAADAVPALLEARPTAVEGLDRRIVDVVRHRLGEAAVPALPRGAGWAFVELTDTDADRLHDRAKALLAASGCLDGQVVADADIAAGLWQIRSDGAGLAGVCLPDPAYAGWEDAAVPPASLGAYLRAFDELLAEHGLHGLPYGHFGDGCVHCRIDFPLTAADGRRRYRAFVEQAARLVAGFGGSLSGEHGDGRARSELLPHMYSAEALHLFAQVKGLFDPDDLLNPGVLVRPEPLDADLRAAALRQSPWWSTERALVEQVQRCSGVGKCVSVSRVGEVMCPSYQATGAEQHSTRGRARVLQEMVDGRLVSGGWQAPEVHDALELCLSCKGCARDCPTGVDIASLKSRVLHERYRGRLRPADHYALGWLPRWARWVQAVPGLSRVANLGLGWRPMRTAVQRLGGLDTGRQQLPRFAAGSTLRRVRRQVGGPGRPVLLWGNCFDDAFESGAIPAVVTVLRAAGYAPQLPDRAACCGLTWISTGQLDGARRRLRAALDVLYPYAAAGIPIVGTEPSCLAVWRSDAAGLVTDSRVGALTAGTFTLAELLVTDPDFRMPSLAGRTIVVQPHCHEASVLGFAAQADLLRRSGATVVRVGGCCGLAGNFGMQRGHHEISVQVAELELLPAIRAAGPDAVVLADGFSCRTQIADLAGRQAQTLAELIAGQLGPTAALAPSRG